jgi:WD40 repeat protein
MHLSAAGREAELVRLLRDPQWIERRLARDDLSGLLADYNRLHSDISVKRIGETIRLSAHVLVDRPEQLATQLIARLDKDDDVVARSLLADVRGRLPRPKLEPRFSSLTGPGSGLVSMMRHRAFYGASAVAGDEQGTVWIVGTRNGTASAFDAHTGNLLWESLPSEHPVSDLAVSDAERVVAILFSDGGARILTIEDGVEVRSYPSADRAWYASSLSRNGLFGVRGRKNGLLERLDLRSGAVKSLPAIKGLSKIAISDSGSYVAVAHAVNKITVFELETGVRRHATVPVARSQWAMREVGGSGQWSDPFEGHSIPIGALAVSDNGSQVACAQDQKVVILDPVGNVVRSEMIGHTQPVTQIRFFHRDALLATASNDRIGIWKSSIDDAVGLLATKASDSGVIGTDVNGRLIGSSADGIVRLWDVEQLSADADVQAHRHGVSAIAISRNGKRAVTGSWDTSLVLWDLETAAEVTRLVGHTDEVVRAAIDEDGGKVVSGALNGEVILWNFDEGEKHLIFKHDDEVTAVSITPSGARLASVSLSYDITSVDLVSRQGFHSTEHFQDVNDVALTRDGFTAVTVSDDGRVLRWNLLEGCVDGEIDLGDDVIRVLITPDEQFFVAATWSRLFLVALPAMQIKSKTKKQKSAIRTFALAPAGEGEYAVTGHKNGDIRVINLIDQSERKLPPHSKPLKALAVTADGKSVVSASEDGTVRVTAIKEAAITAEFVGDSSMNAMALSPQTDMIVAGERSGNVHVLMLHPS